MKALILKSVLFMGLLGGTYFLLVDKLSQGYVDMYYNKFTHEAGGLILGLSRADQGIDPDILERKLGLLSKGDQIVNFAANQNYFGEVYYNAIVQKLGAAAGKGIFVVSVTPGSFVGPKGLGEKGILSFDGKSAIGKTKDFTANPNYSYIMNCYGMGLYTALIEDRAWENLTSHDSGWNELKLNSNATNITPALMRDWKEKNLAYYQRQAQKSENKPHRHEWFIKTLDFLKQEGSVFLIRIPADQEILDFEESVWPGFNNYMDSIAQEKRVPYFDYTLGPKEFATYDGTHLYSESARKFTELLADDIHEHLFNHPSFGH